MDILFGLISPVFMIWLFGHMHRKECEAIRKAMGLTRKRG